MEENEINAQKEKVFKLQRGNNLKMFYETQAIRKKRTSKNESSSEQEHKVNALAQGADEGRDKLR